MDRPPQALLHRCQQQRIHARAESESTERADDESHRRCRREQDRGDDGSIAAKGEELAVRHVDHIQHTENQADADGDQRIDAAEDDCQEQKLEDLAHAQRSPR